MKIILYIPKIDGYLEILTDEEVEDFVAINLSKVYKIIAESQKSC